MIFTNDYNAVEGYDVLLASGSLQYIEAPLAEILNAVQNKPEHIIINLMPVHETKAFITLQNIGTVFCPYKIFNQNELIKSMNAADYKCIDAWRNEEKSCDIPFHPEHSLDHYMGFYFHLKK